MVEGARLLEIGKLCLPAVCHTLPPHGTTLKQGNSSHDWWNIYYPKPAVGTSHCIKLDNHIVSFGFIEQYYFLQFSSHTIYRVFLN
jgi:hypothetical protein